MSNIKMITAQEISEILGLSVETIWRYTREKKIPFAELGPRQYRYVEADVLKALNHSAASIVKEGSSEYIHSKKLTSEEYAKVPAETGYIIQLIDGFLVREPTPTFHHQRVSRRLQQILIAYFQELDPKGEVFNAPLDVYLNEHTVVQPDLLYLPGDRPAKDNPVDSLPELVVEILSPSTARNDRVKKLNCYQQAGIRHYWIVDPNDCLIEAYELYEKHYAAIARFSEGEFNHPNFPGLSFDIDILFKQP